jgi:hypothetical protein
MANFIWKDNIRMKIIKQAQRGMINATNAIFNRSQYYAPFDDGELTLGVRISSEGQNTDTFSTCVSYGNNAVSAQYAVIQHENLLYRHKYPERSKFLETAFLEESPMVQYHIADTIKT